MARQSVKAECSSCGGYGVYSGFCEPEGVAVICLQCNGTGCETVYYKPFVKRHRKKGIKTVTRSRGRFIVTGVGPVGSTISYTEFFKGKMPSEVED